MTHDDADLAAWLRFALVPGIGLRRQLILLQALGSPQNVLAASFGTLSKTLAEPDKAQAFIDFAAGPEPALVAQTRAWLAQQGHRMVCLGDDAYPPQFLELPDAPLFFFCKGRVELLAQQRWPSWAVAMPRRALSKMLSALPKR